MQDSIILYAAVRNQVTTDIPILCGRSKAGKLRLHVCVKNLHYAQRVAKFSHTLAYI